MLSYESLEGFHRAINEIEATTLPQRELSESEEAYYQRVLSFLKTKEMQFLEELHQKNLTVGHLRAEFFKWKKKYKKAITLYDYLCTILPTEQMVDAELERLHQLELLPRETTEKILKEMDTIDLNQKGESMHERREEADG